MVGFLPVIASESRADKSNSIDFAGCMASRSRWARLAGFEFFRRKSKLYFLLPGETELGSAGEQPNEG
jgi:hypothetical protein